MKNVKFNICNCEAVVSTICSLMKMYNMLNTFSNLKLHSTCLNKSRFLLLTYLCYFGFSHKAVSNCFATPGSSIHVISQARILEWVAASFSMDSSQSRDQTHDFCIGRQILNHWATREARFGRMALKRKISCMKWDASPGSMHDTGCLGLVHWDDPEGGGFRMGNTCIPVVDSFWYLAKLIQLCKV